MENVIICKGRGFNCHNCYKKNNCSDYLPSPDFSKIIMLNPKNYEIVQKHEYQDIYRLCYGVLVVVNKYKHISNGWYWNYTKKYKKKLEKIQGLKNCFKTTEDIELDKYDDNEIISKGTVIFEDRAIEPLIDKSKYYFELKTTGSCFSGNYEEFSRLLDTAKEIILKY